MPSTDDRSGSSRWRLAAAAQAAVAAMADELGPLLHEELERLSQARARWRIGAGLVELRTVAHDLRGLGALYGAPLAGCIAGSLERLLSTDHAPRALVEAHVDALCAVVRQDAADVAHPVGGALLAALEEAVAHVARRRPAQAA